MRKKWLVVGYCILLMGLLSGCVSSKARDDIINCLKDENVIGENWKFVQQISNKEPLFENVSFYDYVYQDGTVLYRINIRTNYQQGEEYSVTLYKNIDLKSETVKGTGGKEKTVYHILGGEKVKEFELGYKKSLFWERMKILKEK